MGRVINMNPEIKRKSFHLLGVIYPFLMFLLGRERFFTFMIFFTLSMGILEFLRLHTTAPNGFLPDFFKDLLREREKTKFTGMFWMALGMLISSLLVDNIRVFNTICSYLLIY